MLRVGKIARYQKVYPKDSVIIKEGDANCTEIYFLNKGTALAEVRGKVVGKINPGEFFGEMSSILATPRTASVIALTECDAFAFKGLGDENLYQLMINDQKFVRKLLETLALRIAEVSKRNIDETTSLNREMERYKQACSGAVFILQKATEKYKSKVMEEIYEFVRAKSGMTLGNSADVDKSFFKVNSNLLT